MKKQQDKNPKKTNQSPTMLNEEQLATATGGARSISRKRGRRIFRKA